MSLRVIFMGTPEFAVPTLAGILGAGHEVVSVYTQPPRAAGRGHKDRPSPVQTFAGEAGLPILTPHSLREPQEQNRFAALNADVAVVVAYGLILPGAVLEAPAHGCLNLHASLLPRWRGAAPIQRAIMAGDTQTGVTVMRMEKGLDTGPVCLAEQVMIGPDMTAGELHDRLAPLGADLVVRALAAQEKGSLDCVPQPDKGAVYAHKVEKEETRIDWTRPAHEVHNHIRGLSPFPGAWFEIEINGKRERVKALRSTLAEGDGSPGAVLDNALTVACGDGAVRLMQVQRAGKKAVAAQEFLRGLRPVSGLSLD